MAGNIQKEKEDLATEFSEVTEKKAFFVFPSVPLVASVANLISVICGLIL
jgi:hypothetical protein